MKSFARIGVGAAVAILLVSSAGMSQAAPKPAAKATVGDDCTQASIGKTAAGRGVDKTDLTCLVVTTGSYKGQNK
ncbi:MAG: hypothetical protein O3A27_01015 [Actinomycetota bacterium]|nr:hypothetical protein [Actinomycetota bacterium]